MSESLPRNKCESCGYWFTTAGEERICPDCIEDEAESVPANPFDAFLSMVVSDCVNGRR